MSDIFDDATVREEQFREQALQAARSHVEDHPDLGCNDCFGATAKGKDCIYFAPCLLDWTRKDEANKRNGKSGI